MSIIIAFLVLSFLVFFHELGHFLIAKAFGVKVEVFSIGFGKKILYKTYKGTQYAISAIPLGGYVKLKGQDDINPLISNEDKDSYTKKSPLKRICILLAGPFFNLLLAFIIYMTLALIGQKTILPIIGEIQQDMPAAKSGLQKEDIILKINGEKIHDWLELNEAVIKTKGPLQIIFQRNTKILQTTLEPKKANSKNIFGEKIERNFIGIVANGDIGLVKYNLRDSIDYAFNQTWKSSKLILQSIEKIFSGVVSVNEVGGVISIVGFISKASQNDLIVLLSLVAIISVNLGVLNLFPIPALDGGQILFNLYEFITRKKISPTSLYYLTIFGWILLLALMGLGVYNDIHRLAIK
ncbi:RIP metalloprotease RseP [Helicobacter sp. 13S00477-4]|uniref:RIP metalloprotease RseP n=1 Tax=Helicobacter sp. 13S00477-4 TaxID=1905759 RepID=UPI000BA592CC|nr:RIP metalloprotease RseP [Helicobacter sp. 13S00477-4]PAF51594.1 RIP metalloprotease RseP [Helicobacter sp. 13S00477-4]